MNRGNLIKGAELSSYICQLPEHITSLVDINTNPEDPQLHYDESEMDRVLSSVSSSYSLVNMYHRLVSCVKVKSENERSIGNTVSDKRHTDITPENLAAIWNIGKETAKETLKATTQLGLRYAVRPLSRRYRTDVVQFLDKRRLKCKLFFDTLFSKTKFLK